MTNMRGKLNKIFNQEMFLESCVKWHFTPIEPYLQVMQRLDVLFKSYHTFSFTYGFNFFLYIGGMIII